MFRINAFITKQGQLLLQDKRYAMLQVVILAVLPYTVWLSVAITALVTLRKGWQKGAEVVGVAVLGHFSLSLFSFSITGAAFNTGLIYLPCFIAAWVLRATTSWRAVVGVFFLLTLGFALILHVWMPDFILVHFHYLQAIVQEMQGDSALTSIWGGSEAANQTVLANYFLGIREAGIMFSAALSLMLARSVQSQLFNPEGFKREMLTFRGDTISFFMLIGIALAAQQQNVLAINLLPVAVLYFLLAGLSLSYNILGMKKPLNSWILLLLPLVLMPFVMVPIYVLVGSLDSLFNLRTYLLRKAS